MSIQVIGNESNTTSFVEPLENAKITICTLNDTTIINSKIERC